MSRTKNKNSLRKTFYFSTFQDAISRMNHCSYKIVELDHHPERKNIYNKMEVVLTTHDEENIVTEKDYMLANILDTYYKEYKCNTPIV